MASEGDGLGSFFFYILFVYPITSWFLKPGRFPKDRGLTLAIGFLALIAFARTGYEIKERGPNHYQRLTVVRNSTPLDIKKAYKRTSLELHPDKNKSPNAADEFARLKDAYDVLMDPELRDVYNKFGSDGIKHNRRYDETQMLLEIAIFYATWGMLAYVLTLGKQSSHTRSYIFTGQILMLIAEVSLLLQGPESKLPEWFAPKWTEYEIVQLLHSLFPAYLNGCRSLGSHLYKDFEEELRQRLKYLHEQQQDALLAIRDIQVNLHSLQAAGGRGSGGATGPSATLGQVRATPTGKIKEMEEKLRQRESLNGPRLSEPVKTEAKQTNYTPLIYIAIYIALHVFSSRD